MCHVYGSLEAVRACMRVTCSREMLRKLGRQTKHPPHGRNPLPPNHHNRSYIQLESYNIHFHGRKNCVCGIAWRRTTV